MLTLMEEAEADCEEVDPNIVILIDTASHSALTLYGSRKTRSFSITFQRLAVHAVPLRSSQDGAQSACLLSLS
ncbi:hypothetical protein RRG08_020562 [Elysia crispata]|uniref:Uncharacterized protein n=1 Tax=Elysia crispata TaxID=231223 RepID=A0AAE1A6B2_9GAST|nr:hypothetical protein RRG08_020562 [Elysia crispata]